MTLQLTPELEEQVREQAAQQGREAEAYALSLLQGALTQSSEARTRPFYETATQEEWEREFRAWAGSHTYNTAPIVPLEALRRENLYED